MVVGLVPPIPNARLTQKARPEPGSPVAIWETKHRHAAPLLVGASSGAAFG